MIAISTAFASGHELREEVLGFSAPRFIKPTIARDSVSAHFSKGRGRRCL